MAQKSFRLYHWLPLLLSETLLFSAAGWARDMDAAGAAVSMDYSHDVALDHVALESSPSDIILILSVTVNGQDRGLAQFRMSHGALFASRDTLRRIGMTLPSSMGEIVRLDELVGVTQRYDEETQAISLTVPVNMLDAALTQIEAADEGNAEATTSTGILLNYDVYANYADGDVALNSFTELRAFSGNNVLSTTALVGPGGGRSNMVRLDSAWATSFNAYQRNMLAIDPTDLPATARIERLEQLAIPADRSGILIRFPISSFGAVTMTLTDGNGQIVPQGSVVHIAGREGPPLIVGFDGQLYVENPKPDDILSIELPGGACRVSLPASPPVNSIERLGTVRCRREEAP